MFCEAKTALLRTVYAMKAEYSPSEMLARKKSVKIILEGAENAKGECNLCKDWKKMAHESLVETLVTPCIFLNVRLELPSGYRHTDEFILRSGP